MPVVVGVSAYTPAEAAGLARQAEAAGADGVLATPPPYAHLAPDEIVEFYREVSQATALPFMVYNWPRGVSVDLGRYPGLLGRLAALDRVVAIKDSTGDWLGMLSRDMLASLATEISENSKSSISPAPNRLVVDACRTSCKLASVLGFSDGALTVGRWPREGFRNGVDTLRFPILALREPP